ncbi:MAG: hypothetical protein NWT04_16085 [Verrucomicrobiales bacterium]|nr:hypothetical protein [Verrucomicrobiales bacterium]
MPTRSPRSESEEIPPLGDQFAVVWMRIRVLDSICPPVAPLIVSMRISSTIQTSPNFLP